MANPGVNLYALKNLQADDLGNLIESLQGLATSRTEGDPTPTTPQCPPTPATVAGEEEEIMWEQVGTVHVPLPDRPPTRPPPTTNKQTLEDRTINNLPNPHSTFADICSKQQRKNSLAAYPTIFNLQY